LHKPQRDALITVWLLVPYSVPLLSTASYDNKVDTPAIIQISTLTCKLQRLFGTVLRTRSVIQNRTKYKSERIDFRSFFCLASLNFALS